MSRGVLMYAYNNSEIDYFRIACANALMIKKNLNVPITLVTDEGSYGWGKTSLGDDLINICFENIIRLDRDHNFKNTKIYSDTTYTSKTLEFCNSNHWKAYSLSPYDETLFIDADYLIMSDALNLCWGSQNDFMINHSIMESGESVPYTKYIDEFGIQQYWATVIYFRKCEISEFIFNIVQHIQDNYLYYRQLYYFQNGMFRNDHAFSIAVHMINGFALTEHTVKELPIPGLLMSWDLDDIYKINGINNITLYSEKKEKGTYILSRLKNQDVHIMNKWAINRHADKIIELYNV